MQSDIMIMDGSWSGFLRERGMPMGVCPEHWIWQRPALAAEVARRYLAAGTQYLRTPTFGASPLRLKHWGLDELY